MLSKGRLGKRLRRKLSFINEGRDARLAVNTILAQMSDSLSKGQRIEIRGFGAFTRRAFKNMKLFRDMKTGESYEMVRKTTVKFRTSKAMAKSVNMKTDPLYGIPPTHERNLEEDWCDNE